MLTDISGIDLVIVLVSIVVSLTIHEAMHGFMAHWLGDDTAHREGRLTLNPLVHIDVLTTVLLPMVLIMLHAPPILAARPVPFNPARLKFDEFGAALVGLAGPLTNLALAAVTAGALTLSNGSLSSEIVNALLIFLKINVGFFVFNMIPFPPLDGSRLVYAFAPEGLRRVMEQIEAMGFFFLLAVLLLGFQFIAPVIGNIQDAILHFLLPGILVVVG
jgi:Zn-dependent protease